MNSKVKNVLQSYEIGSKRNFDVSFEFFPAKTDEGEEKLWKVIKDLEQLNPKFVSVTYGAGGSTRERTHNTVKKIRQETNLDPAAHLTCVGASKQEIAEIATAYKDAKINHIVALRGDPPADDPHFTPHPDGYKYSCDLVDGLKKIHDFEISVAAFPEKHPESESFEKDLEYLKAKEAAGANRAITQYFLDPYIYINFLEKIKKANIKIPVVPGILMISNYSQLIRFSKMCGSSVPNYIKNLLQGTDESPQIRDAIVTHINTEMCKIILDETDIDHIHFYTLNRSEQTKAVCKIIGYAQK